MKIQLKQKISKTGDYDVKDVIAICIDENNIIKVIGDENGTVKAWNVDRLNRISFYDSPSWLPYLYIFSPEGKYAYIAGKDVIIWDMVRGEKLKTIKGSNTLNSISISLDGKYFIASEDNLVKVWQTDNFNEITIFKGHDKKITALCITSDNRYAISTDENKIIRIWEIESGREVRSFKTFPVKASLLSCSYDNRYLTCGNSYLRVWDLQRGEMVATLKEQDGDKTDSIKSISEKYPDLFSFPGMFKGMDYQPEIKVLSSIAKTSIIISGDFKGNLRFWDFNSFKNIYEFKLDGSVCACDSTKGQYIAVGDSLGNIYTFELS